MPPENKEVSPIAVAALTTVKVIGRTEYIVESFFNEEANCTITDKIKRLIDHDIQSLDSALLAAETKVTSHDPDRRQLVQRCEAEEKS